MADITYLQAAVIGLLQGVTELFPISSLGHSVLVPAWIGGSWSHLVTEYSSGASEQSPYLAFVVALHVATAIALLVFYRRTWVEIIGAFFTTLRTRRIETSAQRLAWLVVVATIPVGITGLVLEHVFRVLFAKPVAAAAFLTVNGLILLVGERLRARSAARVEAGKVAAPAGSQHRAGAADQATVGAAGSPTAGSTRSSCARPLSSACSRRSRCSPASRARGSRWSAACCAASTTRTPRSSRSCSRRR
jgi:undecaprenyl-diphosphatase